MGFFDAASGTLGAIAGAFCPGELQTLLNQSNIPITMVLSYIFIGSVFGKFQIWGSCLILIGAVVASSNFLERSQGNVNVSSASTLLYVLSVIPGSMSNVYKDVKMKSEDLDEIHTSTMVSYYQVLIGFLFLPLMSLPLLGGLSAGDMALQITDGYQCMLGNNPVPDMDCSNAAFYLFLYITVNFVYNLLVLVMTKRGSAVLLVMAGALSLPVTNIAFSIPAIMGPLDVEPLTIGDLVGLVLVALGFLTYSGFGFAQNFLVTQGPPGQMTYLHIESQDSLLVSKSVMQDPHRMVDFLLQQQRVRSSSISEEEEMEMIPSGAQHESDTEAALQFAQRVVVLLQERLAAGRGDRPLSLGAAHKSLSQSSGWSFYGSTQ